MKIRLFLFFFIFGMLFSCSSANSPEIVVEKFVTAINQNNFKEAQLYADAPTHSLLEKAITIQKNYKNTLPENEFIVFAHDHTDKIDENTAIVHFFIAKTKPIQKIKVKKINQQWKVSLDLQNTNSDEHH